MSRSCQISETQVTGDRKKLYFQSMVYFKSSIVYKMLLNQSGTLGLWRRMFVRRCVHFVLDDILSNDLSSKFGAVPPKKFPMKDRFYTNPHRSPVSLPSEHTIFSHEQQFFRCDAVRGADENYQTILMDTNVLECNFFRQIWVFRDLPNQLTCDNRVSSCFLLHRTAFFSGLECAKRYTVHSAVRLPSYKSSVFEILFRALSKNDISFLSNGEFCEHSGTCCRCYRQLAMLRCALREWRPMDSQSSKNYHKFHILLASNCGMYT